MSKATRYNPSKTFIPRFHAMLLYIFLFPLFISIVVALAKLNIVAFATNIIFFGAFYIVAVLSKKGAIQESIYKQAVLTKAPKIKYKTIAASILAIATASCALIVGKHDFFISIFLGSVGFGGYWLYYGLDPTKDKLPNLGDISAKMVIEVLDDAKQKLSTIEKQINSIKESTLNARLKNASTKAYAIVDAIETSPQRLRDARKFLIVYIDGIANVLNAYSKINPNQIESQTNEQLYNLTKDLENAFDKELTRLESEHQFDLHVHIEALKEKIKY